MQGASPLASPRLNPGGAGFSFGKQCPKGDLSPGLPAGSAVPAPKGGLSFASPAYHAICLPFFPIPLPLRGRGRLFTLFRRGLAPPAPLRLNPRFAAKTAGSNSLRAVPAAKERGDRGRWNYPSQATAAFEMVLSPGAGRTSAAGGLSFASPAYHAICLPFFPHPPVRARRALFPTGRGRIKVISCKGLRPLHPRG